jgi:uncharacterized protein
MSSTPFVFDVTDGAVIRGDVHLPAGDELCPVVVICHGFKGFKDWGFFTWLADQIAAAGCAAVRFNFSLNGVGEDLQNFTELDKFEQNTFSRELADVLAVLGKLEAGDLPANNRLDFSRIGILGHSRGGAIALLTAANDKRIRALTTWSSVPNLFWYPDTHKQWRADGYHAIFNARTKQEMRLGIGLLDDMTDNRQSLDVLAHAGTLQVPTLIVHGVNDEAVPVEAAEMIHRALGADHKQLCLVENAGHTYNAVHPFEHSTPQLDEAIAATTGWFADNL